MNCQQAEDLLPLHAGRDLDEKRAALVDAHLQKCASCARVASEYRGTINLTQQFGAPVFSDHLYAGTRRRVLSEIENQAASAGLLESLVASFRPRTTWAVASALVVALAVLAFYFVDRRSGNEPVAGNRDEVSQSASPGQKEASTASTDSPENSETPTPRPLKRNTFRRGRTNVLTAKVREIQPTKVSTDQAESVEANPSQMNDSVEEQPLRVEIQTKDPNIRIIWFSQPATKPALPSSKGI